ncbi:MAG TPA: DNA repair protein RadA [Gemmatimonadales bacterium]|nr:DNA repair protein RadA [Gemmatimonadales bacterium]HRZ08963.1 DNA repair protein RadA [Gemmatimonadales bacterium]
MARTQSVYRCTECGHDHPKWVGRCEGCEAWNTVAEEPLVRAAATRGARRTAARPTNAAALPAVRLRDIAESRLVRWPTGLPELDFVLGGGIVPGSMTLIGGEPGIGKSTLLLQVAARLESGGRRVLYASGEESPDQLRLRAARLEEDAGPVHVLGETRLEAVLEAAAALPAEFLVLDSIQTVYTDSLESAPGNVGQVRESSALLMRYAKETGTAVVVVGHVTKGGGIAGPKTLEHIVDTVLYFEGEGSLDYRLLRATKNRFGSVDELGVFSMTERGLVAVPNPSAMFLAARATGTSGSAVTALMEGTRPVLVEVQALAAPSGYGTPQRVATGLDPKRLAVLLAVLERRGNTSFASLDVFVQATAGVRLAEPGADLAVAAALLSSLHGKAVPADVLYLGEIGLGGEVRPISGMERRMTEAARLGFRRVFAPGRNPPSVSGITVVGVDHVDQLVKSLAA